MKAWVTTRLLVGAPQGRRCWNSREGREGGEGEVHGPVRVPYSTDEETEARKAELSAEFRQRSQSLVSLWSPALEGDGVLTAFSAWAREAQWPPPQRTVPKILNISSAQQRNTSDSEQMDGPLRWVLHIFLRLFTLCQVLNPVGKTG